VKNHKVDNFNDHFDLVTTDDDGDEFVNVDLDSKSANTLPFNKQALVTHSYNSDLYEVVTFQIDPDSDLFLDNQEEFGVHEYSDYSELLNSNYTDFESEDINEKYASLLDNLRNKYKVLTDTLDGNQAIEQKLSQDSLPKVLLDSPDGYREHLPKLFDDSLSDLVENRANEPKLFDKGLPTNQNAPPSVETTLDTSVAHDMEHPLISLMNLEPHAMKLLVKPRKFEPDTMVRLMYERVPRNKPALQQHLDDPVIEYVHVYRLEQEHYLTDLPMGKYIVCGEAQVEGEVFQSNCFETSTDRLDNNMLQGGVIAVIAVALLIVFSVIMYAIYHKFVLSKRKDIERQ